MLSKAEQNLCGPMGLQLYRLLSVFYQYIKINSPKKISEISNILALPMLAVFMYPNNRTKNMAPLFLDSGYPLNFFNSP
ncbi:hypothetical protein XENTR_v10006731 [Xenopus tropicalis]|nr:hypothetical protein XENTR_v10006731 [Xenopus tropicalis]